MKLPSPSRVSLAPGRKRSVAPALALLVAGCQPIVDDTSPLESAPKPEEEQLPADTGEDTSTPLDADTEEPETAEEEPCESPVYDPDPFADAVVSFTPGEGAGFGQEDLPHIVLGPPRGGGPSVGSLDVLSLGQGGEIVLEFTGYVLSDGPGDDLLVFENAFPGWPETAIVSASVDGTDWISWPCDSSNIEQGFPGCAGVEPVLSNPENCIVATDPEFAGGDGFDLSQIGLDQARFIKLVDTGSNPIGGFDLDAVAIIHGTIQ